MEQQSAQGGKKPSKFKDLMSRCASGAVYSAITIACFLINPATLLAYLAITAVICTHELLDMTNIADETYPSDFITLAGAAAYLVAFFFFGAPGIVCTSVVLVLAFLAWLVFDAKSHPASACRGYFFASYTGMLLCGLLGICMSVGGFSGCLLALLVVASIWISDAMAYLVGCRFGKHKLAPRISPKKSWEGFVAGIVGAVAVWVAISFLPGVDLSLALAVVFGIFIASASLLGDLAESRIKRIMGVKDSGNLIPGHGGLLDRTDSILAAGALAFALLVAFGCIPSAI